MWVSFINKYQILLFKKVEESHIKIVKLEIEILKLKIFVQILDLIKNKIMLLSLRLKILLEFEVDKFEHLCLVSKNCMK